MGVREFAQPETLGVFDHGVFTWAKVLPMLSQGATDGTSGTARDHLVDRRGAKYVEVRWRDSSCRLYPRGNDFVITCWFYCSGRADQPKYLQTAASSTFQRHLATERDGD